MKVMGTNIPHSIKKMPSVVSVNRGSRKAARSIVTPLPFDRLLSFFLESNRKKDLQREGFFFSPIEIGNSDEMEAVEVMVSADPENAMKSSRLRINQFEMSNNNRQINPVILTAHPNPTFGVAD